MDTDSPAAAVRPTALAGHQRRHLEEQGYLVLPGMLSHAECDRWGEVIDRLAERGASDGTYTVEPGVQFVPNLLQHSLLFEKCIGEPAIVGAMRSVLGPAIVFSLMNARSAGPGHGNQPLHELKRSRGRPFRWCNAIWCLDPFTRANGATRVLPGSHQSDERFLATMTDPLLAHPAEVHVVAPKGAVIVFNSHLIHAGSRNTTTRPRRSIQTQYSSTAEGSHYDWRALPAHIKAGLRPESLDLLGLGPA